MVDYPWQIYKGHSTLAGSSYMISLSFFSSVCSVLWEIPIKFIFVQADPVENRLGQQKVGMSIANPSQSRLGYQKDRRSKANCL